ncbi:hypothetical protein [Paraburkholderia terricola]|uniref:tRNA G10 N-methylase Trm11 n=1 Tax=Paraburkholderia terricola TaxID=169427 RepID=A0ABU1LVE7_9BURK|nr:hypothetical protein [Paraburkholderia terricola]MDR6410737.1 tRNA G10 N-methylase Trm11 [Paraburkholderia terricola]MDR6484973.1 tRNA G10 N-methylase Trm11 [Paraburkholderia terricola]
MEIRRFDRVVISNPKRYVDRSSAQDARVFPYYAGYSTAFTEQLLLSLGLRDDATVFDPWNGSGTTTQTAYRAGIPCIGTDLNPVMVVVAKAGLLSALEVESLSPLAQTIVEQAAHRQLESIADDPLHTWLIPQSASAIRGLEQEIHRTLVSHAEYRALTSEEALASLSPLAALFYVALFRTTRRFLIDFIPSNPTWTKRPNAHSHRKRPSSDKIYEAFAEDVRVLSHKVVEARNLFFDDASPASVRLGNAERIGIQNNSIGAVISSPPYCTRIDYAVATALELAVLRVGTGDFDALRRSLTGTSTVERGSQEIDTRWGETCLNFLDALYQHSSKASKTYYFKNHVQYFRSLHTSLQEIARVLEPQAPCVLVVQDSYYKQIRNNIAQVTCEMAANVGLQVRRQEHFSATRSMVGMNQQAKKYLQKRTNIESVLCFENS